MVKMNNMPPHLFQTNAELMQLVCNCIFQYEDRMGFGNLGEDCEREFIRCLLDIECSQDWYLHLSVEVSPEAIAEIPVDFRVDIHYKDDVVSFVRVRDLVNWREDAWTDRIKKINRVVKIDYNKEGF